MGLGRAGWAGAEVQGLLTLGQLCRPDWLWEPGRNCKVVPPLGYRQLRVGVSEMVGQSALGF